MKMDPRAEARKQQEKIEKRANSGNFIERLPFLPKFNDKEERILRIICSKEALQWLIDNPEKNHDDYTEEVDNAVGFAWKDTSQHFAVGSGNASLPCLREINMPCPICEAYEEDIKSGTEAIKKAASNIRCKHRYTFFVEWRGHEDEGPFIWSPADEWSDMAMAHIADNDHSLIYDPFIGHDLKVIRRGTGRSNTKYTITVRSEEVFLYEVVTEEDGEEVSDFDFEKGTKVLEVLPSIVTYMVPELSYEDYEAILTNEKTVKQCYKEKFGKEDEEDDGTEFNTEKIESEEKPARRRRKKK